MNGQLSMSLRKELVDIENLDLVGIISVILVALVLIVIIRRLLPFIVSRLPARFRHHILPVIPVLRLAVVVLAIAMIVPLIMKPTAQNLFFLLGTFAVAIGFAFKDYVSSLIAGVIAVFEKPYRVGDRVRIDDIYGEVRLIGFRAVKIVTPDDTAVTIPHSKIWNSSIQNANDGQLELLCVAEFYLHPEHDANAVRDRLLDIARTSLYVARERPIDVIISEKPWYTQYRLKAYVIDGRDEFQYITDMTIKGKQLFRDMGVRPASIPSPVHMKNGTIPS